MRDDSPRHGQDPRDFYATPQWARDAALRWLDPWTPTLDPCAGSGALLMPGMRGYEIQSDLASCAQSDGWDVGCCDGLARGWRGERVLMNPPFGDAEAWVRKAVAEADSACVLLRLGFLAGQKRMEWWREHPPSGLLVLSRCPSFAHGRTDSADYCWAAWGVWPMWSGQAAEVYVWWEA